MKFLDEILQELWSGFVEPICDPYINGGLKKLVIVPHGGLQIFPIHAAYRDEDGKRRYVATDWSVRYVLSLRSLRATAQRTRPVFKRPLSIGLGRYRDPRLRRLALAEAETWSVASFMPPDGNAVRLCGREATLGEVVKHIVSADLLHFACHATWNPNPELCALQLWADRSGTREELTAARLEKQIDLSAVRLVVLSACESGVAEHIFAPEESAGLAGSILKTGCHGVISSLWAVHDLAAFLLWSRFYDELRHSLMPEEALRNSQHWLRQLTVSDLFEIHTRFPPFAELVKAKVESTVAGLSESQKPFSHPQLWAPFVLFGD
jgi:CHAT domain-containing protein